MGNGGISYHWFNPRGNKNLISRLISCHREVIEPELSDRWMVCQVCNESWSKKKEIFLNSINFTHCGSKVSSGWAEDEFIAYIFHNINLEDDAAANCWLSFCENTVIGYAWGFSRELDFLEERLDAPGLKRFVRKKFGDVERVVFQDRIGVVERFRKNGIAKRLASLRSEEFLKSDIEVVATMVPIKTASFVYEWYLRRGFCCLYEMNDSNRNMVLVRKLEGLVF